MCKSISVYLCNAQGCKSTADDALRRTTQNFSLVHRFTQPPPFLFSASTLAHCSSESCLIIAFMTGNTPLPGLAAAADLDGAISVLVSQSLQDSAGVSVCVCVFPPFPPPFWCAGLAPSVSSGRTSFVMCLEFLSIFVFFFCHQSACL